MRVVRSKQANQQQWRRSLTLFVLFNCLLAVLFLTWYRSIGRTESKGFTVIYKDDSLIGDGDAQDRVRGTTLPEKTKKQDDGAFEDAETYEDTFDGDGEEYSHLRRSEEKEGLSCQSESRAEYSGEEVVKNGATFLVDSKSECEDACRQYTRCNVWVWCSEEKGEQCGWGRKHRECWLKHAVDLDIVEPQGKRGPMVPWISGTCVLARERKDAQDKSERKEMDEKTRLAKLKANESLPLVYFDVEIKGRPVGRIEMVLYTDISPRAAENFRQLVTGEAGVVPAGHTGEGLNYHLKGAPFYRIIHNFIDQSGINVDSVYGGQFKDDAGGLKLKHEKKGLLSMANMGPNTNTAHFSIMMGPAPHLDGSYTIFGQVVEGFDAVDAINNLSIGKDKSTATAEDGAVIANCGQIRKGMIMPNLDGP